MMDSRKEEITIRVEVSKGLYSVCKLWKYCYLLPEYIYNTKENTFVCKWSFSRILTCVSFFFICTILLKHKLDQYGSNINSIAHLTHNFYFVVFISSSLLIVYRNKMNLENILCTVMDIIRRMEGFCVYSNHSEGISRLNIYWLSSYMIGIISMFALDLYLRSHGKNIISIVIVLARYSFNMVNLQTQFFFITINNILNYNFKILRRCSEDISGAVHLEELMKLNDLIKYTSLHLFDIFSIIILFILGNVFCAVVISQFGRMTEIYSNINFLTAILFWIWSFITLISLFTIMESIMNAESQSKLTIESIYNTQTRIGRKNQPYKSMELFLLKSKLNESKFSVCGFFPLDWTLIYSMVAGITTYLVYLIQFREMEGVE